jgi:hypothetical protein
MREDDASGEAGFVVAGKSTDNKIYASAGIMSPENYPQLNPYRVPGSAGDFKLVGNTTYTTGGEPALAMSNNAFQSSVLIAFMGDDRRIYGKVRPLPYLSNSWSPKITGPQLPTGWTPVGAPTIATTIVTFQILVHAINADGSQHRLFETHFYGQSFSGPSGVPEPVWAMLPNMGRIDGSPSLTYHNTHGLTVYFLRLDPSTNTGQIMQTGGWPLGSNPVLAVKPNAGINFVSSPSAIANWGFESQNGRHSVTARTTSNQLYTAVTMMDDTVVP